MESVSYTHLDVYKRQSIMNAYGFIVDFRENVVRVGQEMIKLCMAEMIGFKQAMVADEEVSKCGEDELL